MNLTTICNFEYFSGFHRTVYREMCNPANAPSIHEDQNNGIDIWTTRLIRVLPEVQDDINQYIQCVSYCKCGSVVDLQEDEFYFDVMEYPLKQLFCSISCA